MSKLEWKTWGAERSPAVLLLHGFMGSGRDWASLAERLSRTHYVIVPDLPGHGASRAVSDELFALDGLVDSLKDRLPLTFSMLGYSMGGRIAGHLAVRHPSRVERLVLESAHTGLSNRVARASRTALDEERAASIQSDLPAFVQDWYAQPLFAKLDDATRQSLVTQRQSNDPAALARALLAFTTGRQPPFGDRLRESGVSTLAIAGALDRGYANRAADLADESETVSACIVPESGHVVHLEQPDRFMRTVVSFLSNPSSHPFPCP